MIIGILSDTHDEFERTGKAMEIFSEAQAQAVIHCGDLFSEKIVELGTRLPFYFVFGNHDADMVGVLTRAADRWNANCLNWRGEIELANKRIAVVHGHLTSDVKPLLDANPDYLLSGHFHEPRDFLVGTTRRINPGALFRAERFTVAILNLVTDQLEFIELE